MRPSASGASGHVRAHHGATERDGASAGPTCATPHVHNGLRQLGSVLNWHLYNAGGLKCNPQSAQG
eukprot:9781450-Alexandrium_andersonii.AAC.1